MATWNHAFNGLLVVLKGRRLAGYLGTCFKIQSLGDRGRRVSSSRCTFAIQGSWVTVDLFWGKKIRQQHTSQTLPSARCAAAHRPPGKWSNNSNWKAKQHRTPATNSVLTKGSEQPTMATACRALNILVVCPESDVWWTPTLGCLGHHGTPLFNNKIQHSLVTPSFHHLVMETEQQSHLVDKETQVWAVNICIKIARLGE